MDPPSVWAQYFDELYRRLAPIWSRAQSAEPSLPDINQALLTLMKSLQDSRDEILAEFVKALDQLDDPPPSFEQFLFDRLLKDPSFWACR